MNAYYIIDDAIGEGGKEGFIVMYGDPKEAVGVKQYESLVFGEAKTYIADHMEPGEEAYRVRLERRHGEHSVTRIFI